jgi:hypothetical protein
MENEKKVRGLKALTKPHSKQVRMGKGGKELVPDTSKPNRKYKVGSEK